MTEAWQQEGRINQKRRTRAAIVAAAVELLEQGKRPTVAEVAEAALVSRATAYRYFPTQEYLLFEAALESTRSDIDRELAENTLSEDPEARLAMLIEALQGRIVDKEAAFRTMLRLSLEQTSDEERHDGESAPSRLRGGGRVRWIEKALAPVQRDGRTVRAVLVEPAVLLHQLTVRPRHSSRTSLISSASSSRLRSRAESSSESSSRRAPVTADPRISGACLPPSPS